MKRYFVLSLLFICALFCSANLNAVAGDVVKARGYSVALWTYSDGWSKWVKTNVLIVMDFDRSRFTIHSDVMQEYDIVDVEVYNAAKSHFSFSAVDQDGDMCTVEMYGPKYPKRGNRNQLYIRFSNVQWCYNFRLL